MIKTTGLEFKRFYHDPLIWGNNGWCDGLELIVNDSPFDDQGDVDTLNDTDKIPRIIFKTKRISPCNFKTSSNVS